MSDLRELAIRAARARIFLLDYIRLVHRWEPRGHQLEWIQALQDLADGRLGTNRLLILAPPASGKTDTVLEFIPWYLGRLAAGGVPSSVGYVCHSEGMAFKRSDQVKTTIEQNEMYRLVFPEAAPDYKRKWSQGQWFLRREKSLKDPTFTGSGIDSKTYGDRYNSLIVMDDPLDPSDTGAAACEHVWEVWKKKVENRGAVGVTPVIGICTRYVQDDWPGRVIGNESDKWKVIRTPALREDETTYWEPEVLNGINLGISTKELLDLREQEPDIFLTVMQALPPSEGGGVWQMIMEGPRPNVSEVESVWQFWDTALTARETSTYNAMVEVWKLPSMRLFVNRVINQKAWPQAMHQLISDAYWQASEMFPGRVHPFIENKAGAQETRLALQKDYGVPLAPRDIPNKDLTARSGHAQRFFSSGQIFIPETWEPWKKAYIEQLRSFPNGQYTDMVSATVLMAEKLFPATAIGRPQPTFLVEGYKHVLNGVEAVA